MRPTRAFVLFALLCLSHSFRLETSCETDTQYYDSTILDCLTCPANQVVNATSNLSCQCAPGTAKTEATKDFPDFICEVCPSGKVASSDHYTCQACPTTIGDKTECTCGDLQAIVELSSDGEYYDQKQCVLCSEDSYQGPGSYGCQSCPSKGMNRTAANDYQCECDSDQSYLPAGSGCVLSSAIAPIEAQYTRNRARQVLYTENKGSTGTGLYTLDGSDTFDYFYYKSADGCRNHKSIQDCQALANLCVLQLYNMQTVVCQLFRDLVATVTEQASEANPDPGWKKGMPWLYYLSDPSDIVDRKAEMTVTFDTSSSDKVGLLEFKLAKYHMDGRFLGFLNLTDQLVLCPHSAQDTERYRRFGTNVKIECTMDVSLFVDMEDTFFYELYLVDDGSEGEAGKVLRDVPIRIINYRDESGSSVNDGSQSSWQLVRRFYIYDNVSGRLGPDAYISKSRTTILQYLKSAMLSVYLQTDEDEKIYIPYFTLEYQSQQVSYMEGSGGSAGVSFESEYVMDIGNFLQIAMGILILAHAIVLFVCIVRTYVWTKNNPPAISRETYIFWLCGKGIMIFLGTWTFIIFWYMFLLSGYWFIFFKMQYHVFVLLPSAYDSRSFVPFAAIVALLTMLHLLIVLDLIRRQSKTDFFFIDWETPNRVLRPGTDQLKAIADEVRGEAPKADYYKLSVSAWRSIFVANELNELQVQRYVSIEFTLLFMVYFLE